MPSQKKGDNPPSPKESLSELSRFFQNPWSEATQKVRNQLLIVSVVGILMAAVGIVPKEITALGLKIEDINQRALLIVWAIVDAYFIITLLSYAYSDFMSAYINELFKIKAIELPQDDIIRKFALSRMEAESQFKNLHVVRLLIDVLIPLLAGLTAFGWLLWRICCI